MFFREERRLSVEEKEDLRVNIRLREIKVLKMVLIIKLMLELRNWMFNL